MKPRTTVWEQDVPGNGKLAFFYDIRLGEAGAPAWLVSCPTGKGTAAGYCSFVLPASRLKPDLDGQEGLKVICKYTGVGATEFIRENTGGEEG